MFKLFKPQGAQFSFEYFLSKEILDKFGIQIVNDRNEADFIYASTFRELKPHIIDQGDRFKYFIWCNEPVWMLPEEVDYATLEPYILGTFGVDLRVMSYLDESMAITSQLFLASWYYTKSFLPSEIGNRQPKIFYAGESRDSDYFENSVQSNCLSLNRYRTRLALKLHEFDQIDIIGRGWPPGVSLEDSRSGNWIDSKLDHLSSYKFSLSIENCLVRGYVSEKIWQPISVGCLPIYYSGGNSSIESMLPLGSFVDASSFDDAAMLSGYLSEMPDYEYNKRVKILYEIFLENVLSSPKISCVQEKMAALIRDKLLVVS